MLNNRFLLFAHWYANEKGMTEILEMALKQIKLLKKNYIYIKKYEGEYGAALMELCRKVELVLFQIN